MEPTQVIEHRVSGPRFLSIFLICFSLPITAGILAYAVKQWADTTLSIAEMKCGEPVKAEKHGKAVIIP